MHRNAENNAAAKNVWVSWVSGVSETTVLLVSWFVSRMAAASVESIYQSQSDISSTVLSPLTPSILSDDDDSSIEERHVSPAEKSSCHIR